MTKYEFEHDYAIFFDLILLDYFTEMSRVFKHNLYFIFHFFVKPRKKFYMYFLIIFFLIIMTNERFYF